MTGFTTLVPRMLPRQSEDEEPIFSGILPNLADPNLARWRKYQDFGLIS